MTRRLEGKKFYTTHNNGVVALVAEEILRNREQVAYILSVLRESVSNGGVFRDDLQVAAREGLRHIAQVPIFTFADEARAKAQPWFTGGPMLYGGLNDYIQREGGHVIGVGFFVPFSNACEFGIHGAETMRDELKFVTTAEQFLDTFGIRSSEVEDAVRSVAEGASKI